jgi:hypothetical protein
MLDSSREAGRRSFCPVGSQVILSDFEIAGAPACLSLSSIQADVPPRFNGILFGGVPVGDFAAIEPNIPVEPVIRINEGSIGFDLA